MRFHEFSWKNIKLTKFTLFQAQMWNSTIIHALSMNFYEKISNFKNSHFSKFRCEIQVLFMRFHEFSWKNIKLWKIHTFPSSDVRFKYYSCAFMNFHEKYQTHKVHTFPSSDVRFKYYSCAFINFHEILNFQSSHFSKFRCEIQLLFMRFHEFSWKISNLKVHTFSSSDVRFKYYSCAFMNFHEKISNFKNSHFSKFRC
jgi:hypothetical protein